MASCLCTRCLCWKCQKAREKLCAALKILENITPLCLKRKELTRHFFFPHPLQAPATWKVSPWHLLHFCRHLSSTSTRGAAAVLRRCCVAHVINVQIMAAGISRHVSGEHLERETNNELLEREGKKQQKKQTWNVVDLRSLSAVSLAAIHHALLLLL